MRKVKIIHISDLHLFVDREGNSRELRERAWTARVMESLGSMLEKALPSAYLHEKVEAVFSGIDVHSDDALVAMLGTIDRLLEDTSIDWVVLQTGDISTFGALVESESVTFPEWEYWTGPMHEARRARAVWVDLFGNHDVWPGTLPILGAGLIERVVLALRTRYFPDPMPMMFRLSFEMLDLELHAVNSVLSEVIDNTSARGELRPDAPDPTATAIDPLDCIVANAGIGNERLVRALLMHHPPHHFKKPGTSPEGGLQHARRLGEWIEGQRSVCPIDLVIAGHRHAIDPPIDATDVHEQPPLPNCTLQLVCNSPTQLPRVTKKEAAPPKPSFNVYEVEPEGVAFRIKRTIFTHRRFSDRWFQGEDAGQFLVRCG